MTPSIQSYNVPRFLKNPHLQTLGAYLLRPRQVIERYPIKLETPDRDELILEKFGAPGTPGDDESIVLMLHGLEGCARSSYILELSYLLKEANFQPIGLNFRSCGGYLNKRKRTYHAGETGDLHFAVKWIRSNLSPASLSLVGFSLGGNVALKYLGERGSRGNDLIDSAVAISVPFDLERGAHFLTNGLSRIYDLHFLTLLKQTIRAKNKNSNHDYDLKALLESNTLYDFDDKITAPVHGFQDAEHYYRKASCIPHLEQISVPTLIMHSRDDPLIPFNSVPVKELENNQAIQTIFTDYGGHVGFVETGNGSLFSFWSEQQAMNFINSETNR